MGSRRVTSRAPLLRLYRAMATMRAFEESLGELWRQGLISGELHLGIGEEAAVAGVVDHLREGDSIATDHRSTPPLVARGADLQALILEMLGHPDGLCSGQGGHMHLFDRDRMIASSGIVGAAACTACGFALAHQQQGAGNVAVAFFGEGAANQGMVLEALNLAAVWRLPVVFVCKDNRWAITTRSAQVTAGSLVRRARAFGLWTKAVDGGRPWTVWRAARGAVERARQGCGPSFLLVRVKRPHGHFEGDSLVRVARHPGEALRESRELVGVARLRGGERRQQARGLLVVARTVTAAMADQARSGHDPLLASARRLDPDDAAAARADASRTVDEAVSAALATVRATS